MVNFSGFLGALFLAAVVAGYIFKMTSVSAFEDTFIVGTGIIMLAMLPALFLPAKNKHRAGEVDSIEVLD